MDIRQLQYFVLVADEKGFVKASKKAFVSQQALSKAIANLESELGFTLFERGKSGAELTVYGRVLYYKAIRIIGLVDETMDDLTAAEVFRKKSITFGFTFRLFDIISTDELFRFQEEHPEWDLQTIEGADNSIESSVFLEKMDIGCIGCKSDIAHFDYHGFQHGPTHLAVNKANPIAKRKSVKMKDLADQTFVIGNSNYNAYPLFIEACQHAGFVPHIGHQSANISWTRELVRMNRAIFLCPGVPETLNDPDIAIIPIEDDPNLYSLNIITKKHRKLSPQVEAFRNYIVDVLTSKTLKNCPE